MNCEYFFKIREFLFCSLFAFIIGCDGPTFKCNDVSTQKMIYFRKKAYAKNPHFIYLGKPYFF